MKQGISRLGRLRSESTLFFLCDIQKVFQKVIHNMPRVEQTAIQMAKAASILDIPIIATEHNLKKFGSILESIKDTIDKEKSHWFEKSKFSMCTDHVSGLVLDRYPNAKSAVIFGIEAHVCVQQTALDLIEMGYDVHLALDGISSQRAHDRDAAIRRMEQSGAFLSTSEGILFELLNDSEHPKFKDLQPLFREMKVAEFDRL